MEQRTSRKEVFSSYFTFANSHTKYLCNEWPIFSFSLYYNVQSANIISLRLRNRYYFGIKYTIEPTLASLLVSKKCDILSCQVKQQSEDRFLSASESIVEILYLKIDEENKETTRQLALIPHNDD